MSEEQQTPRQLFQAKAKPTFKPTAGKGIIEDIIARRDDELIPWETCTLPSKGLYYEGMIPGGVVEVRPMGMVADKILATQRLAQSGKSLDYLFKHCVKLPQDFSPFSLLAGDRVFLLYYLRGITHGNMYEFVVECSNEECKERSTHEYDLNNLEIKYADTKLGEEPWTVALPKMSETVGAEIFVRVRLLRGYDLLKMTNEIKSKRKARPDKRFVEQDMGKLDNAVIDETLSANLTNLIVEVGSGTEIHKEKETVLAFVDKLHSSDHAVIREFVNENSPGVDTKITIACPHCGIDMKMDLPITEGFFRPQK